jgi:uncharacterized protein YbjT (DUF2867 family)
MRRTRVLVVGATGCVGRAVVNALRARGHQVVSGSRTLAEGRHTLAVDFMQPVAPAVWAERLRALKVDAVVNCVGILMPSATQSFERLHTQGPVELFRGAALAGVRRIVQVSALGVSSEPEALARPYLHSKLQADEALAALPVEWAVLRPSLIYGPHSQSAALFATLASLPVVSLPGRGRQPVQPIHVFEVAEAVARVLEQTAAPNRVFELGGPQVLRYREMLAHYRRALGLGDAVWLPVPMPLMRCTAWLAEALPQQVLCRDTIALLERGNVAADNAAPALLGRAPTAMAQGLKVSPPQPLVDLRVQLSPAVEMALRVALAVMWIHTALITLLWPQDSGVMDLLARCGFEGSAAVVAMLFSCTLNLALGAAVLLRPGPWVYAFNTGAVLGYTFTAAWHMPELVWDHCGPLIKNLPVLGLVMLLWMAQGRARAAEPVRKGQRAVTGRAAVPTEVGMY